MREEISGNKPKDPQPSKRILRNRRLYCQGCADSTNARIFASISCSGTQTTTNEKVCLKLFKQHCFEKGLLNKPEEHLKQLRDHSRLFSYIIRDQHPDKEINAALDRIRILELKPLTPYLMELFIDLESGELSKQIFLESLKVIENYVIRRSICDIPSSSYRKTFLSLHREVKKVGADWKSNYPNYLEFVFARKYGRGRYPNNVEVLEALKTRNFYKLYPATRNLILESMENHGKRETVDVINGLDEGNYSIEHVMPQKLSSKWKKQLGSEHSKIHERYVNTLGNLTVTAFNSKMSNNSFEEKLKTGFQDSPFWLNSFIKDQSKWSEDELLERTRILTDRVLDIWQEFELDGSIETEAEEEVFLSEFDSFVYSNPIKLTIEGREYDVSTFREVKESVLRDLMERDVDKLFYAEKHRKRRHVLITRNPADCSTPREFEEGFFTEGHSSANSHINSIIEALGFYDVSLDDVSITIESERRNKFKKGQEAA